MWSTIGFILFFGSMLGVLFLVMEIRVAQHGGDTWGWVNRLYKRHRFLQRIRW